MHRPCTPAARRDAWIRIRRTSCIVFADPLFGCCNQRDAPCESLALVFDDYTFNYTFNLSLLGFCRPPPPQTCVHRHPVPTSLPLVFPPLQPNEVPGMSCGPSAQGLGLGCALAAAGESWSSAAGASVGRGQASQTREIAAAMSLSAGAPMRRSFLADSSGCMSLKRPVLYPRSSHANARSSSTAQHV